MQFLRQSTASQVVRLGPFLDSSDFSAETALTIANTDIKIFSHAATSTANKNSGGATHVASGWYHATLDATDTATVGRTDVYVAPAGVLPVWKEFWILEEAVYDALFAASAPGYVANAPVNVAQFGGTNGTFASGRPEVNATHFAGTAVASATVNANMTQISGDSTAADNLETAFDGTAGPVPHLGILDQGTAQSTDGSATVIRAAAAFGDDTLIGATIHILGSTQGYWQSALIHDNVLSTNTVSHSTLPVTPTGTLTYKIIGSPQPNANLPVPIDEAAVADAVWEEDITDHSGTSSSTAEALAAAGSAGDPWTTTLPGSYTGSQAGKMLSDILTDTGTTLQGELDGIQADTEDIQTRLPAALVGGRIDATVDETGMEAGAVSQIQSGLATAAELAKVPKSDGTASWNATALAAINAEVDTALTDYDAATGTELAAVDAKIDTIDGIVDDILDDTGTSGVLVNDTTPIEVNIVEVNDVALVGDGSGTPWGPA